MNRLHKLLFLLGTLGILTACIPPSMLEKAMEKNPEILYAAIKANPEKFLEVVNEAAKTAQENARKKQAEAEVQKLESDFQNPKSPNIDTARAIFGPKEAPITIVEYSDFECPYCAVGYNVIKEVQKAYGDKVRVVYKHLPLMDRHPMALPAAQYFEAIALQSVEKAEKFHDGIFADQASLKSKKETFLKDLARKVGADMGRLQNDIKSDAVKARIEADMAEAQKFEFSGTPGFLVNGVALRGAYPFPDFKVVIDRILGQAPQN